MLLISCDHAGFSLTSKIVKYLDKKGIEYTYYGPKEYVKQDSYVENACNATKNFKDGDKLLLVCGSGVGMSMVANKHKNIRAVLGYSPKIVEKAVQHNNANCLCLGQNFTTYFKSIRMINAFLNSKFEGGRHCKRVEELNNLIK